MLRTFTDYHTPIIDIWQKPSLQIKWFYSQKNYSMVKTYLFDNYHVEWADYLRYYNNKWNGITSIPNVKAWLECPEWYSIPFKDFVNLIDFKIHTLNTSRGKIQNPYTTIFISSHYSIYDVYSEVSSEKINKICRFMEINLIDY